ncbi:MAG: NADH-quinone oxidoreductase subunit L [Ignavibacteriae bacterium]|nr:NADH-quinone oxidoreductase subunit L [Ignavibacteriota bacterium]
MSPQTLTTLTIAILFLPLASFVILLAFGKRLPRQGDFVGTAILFLTLALSLVVMIGSVTSVPAGSIPGFPAAPVQSTFTWVDFNTTMTVFGQNIPMRIELGIMIDNLVGIMLVVVSLISALVHLFSIGYMHGDAKYSRYFAYLGLFTFSMMGIVVTNNILMMYIFWELVGLSSYLLIGFWYEKPGPAYASKKAFLVNRIGDIGMWIGIMILFTNYGTFSFDKIFASISAGNLPFGSETWLTVAGICIFCGAVGKSAQFPLHTWLPDAMEGPTPVSALIHAATMVAAGVYLVARVFPMLSGDALFVIAVTGALTAFISATIAIAQNDIKKVLAYSTVSQLGYMVLALGVGAYQAGIFHLVTHAMFKACLFLGSGSVIHAMHHSLHHLHDHETDPQDIRNMGGLKGKLPVTYLTFLVATLAISGVPLFSGFMSKDEILAGAWAFGSLRGGLGLLMPYIGFGVAMLTAFYMFRLVFLTFHGEPKRADVYAHLHESPVTMKTPLIVLATLSLWFVFSFNPFGAASGWILKSLPVPVTVTGQNWYAFSHGEGHETAAPAHTAETHETTAPAAGDHAAAPAEATVNPAQETFTHGMHQAHMSAMITSLLVAGLGILVAWGVYRRKMIDVDAFTARVRPLHVFLSKKWFFDEIYEQWVVVPFLLMVTRAMAWFDAKVVDGAVNGVASVTRFQSWLSGQFDKYVVDGLVNFTGYAVGFFGILFRKTQTGRIQTYIAFLILGVIVLFYVYY